MKVMALVTPAKAGVHLGSLDSRFRGNDVTFDGAKRRISAVLKIRQLQGFFASLRMTGMVIGFPLSFFDFRFSFFEFRLLPVSNF
jgi:hypothetical protein